MTASTAQYNCQHCKGLFTARTADRARGWARYCSKSCKAKKQEQRTGQYQALTLSRSESDMEAYGSGFASGSDEDMSWSPAA